MGHIIADLKETFRRGNIFIQLIYINVGIFLIGTLINVFLRLFEVSTPDIFGIFALPASFIGFMHQPWSRAARPKESQLSARKPRKGKVREYYRKSLRWRLL